MYEAGIDDLVRKPYRSSEIYECMAKLLGLKYRYQVNERSTDTQVVLIPQMFAGLSGELRQELRTALESLVPERIGQVLGKLAGVDATLHGALKPLIENFDYPTILNMMDKIEKVG